MRNQAFFSSHRLFHFFFVALAWTHTVRQTYTQGLKNIRSTQLSAIEEYAFSFVFPLFTLFCLHLRGSAVAVPVFGMFARLMEYTNLTTQLNSEIQCVSSPHWELHFFFPAVSAFVPESSIISENISSGLRRATHSVCVGGRQCGGMWVSSMSTQQTVCRSPDLRGIGGEMRRQTPPHTSQTPWCYCIGKLGSGERSESCVHLCVRHSDKKSLSI